MVLVTAGAILDKLKTHFGKPSLQITSDRLNDWSERTDGRTNMMGHKVFFIHRYAKAHRNYIGGVKFPKRRQKSEVLLFDQEYLNLNILKVIKNDHCTTLDLLNFDFNSRMQIVIVKATTTITRQWHAANADSSVACLTSLIN